MSRKALLTALPAAAIAAAIGVGVIGSPVDSADAARPFSVSKSQFTSVKKNATTALKKSNQNAAAIAQLKASGVAGPQGAQGLPGGFDPAKVVRVAGPVVPVPAAEDYVSYTLPCPAGTIALSGGWVTSSAATEKAIRVSNSFPSSGLTGWSFRFAYSAIAPATANVTPYAVCAGA
jgi:hypothetical protein